MVGLGRVELPTSPLSGVRSSQLSYRPFPQPNRRVFGPECNPRYSLRAKALEHSVPPPAIPTSCWPYDLVSLKTR
jgi:hypothetical protein